VHKLYFQNSSLDSIYCFIKRRKNVTQEKYFNVPYLFFTKGRKKLSIPSRLLSSNGHTDVIGEVAHNPELSKARAEEVKGIIEKALIKSGMKEVKFEFNRYGEHMIMEPFENKFPEERFYNRTIIIDIIPPN
jgi:hypothetical protein